MTDPVIKVPTAETAPQYGSHARSSRLKSRRQSVLSGMSLEAIPRFYAKLFVAGVVGLLSYYNFSNPSHKQPLTLLLASLVFMAGCLPMLFFLWRGKAYQVPLVEAHAMFYAVCFGWAGFLPIESGSAALILSEAEVQTALGYTLAGLLALFLGYYAVGAPLFRRTLPLRSAANLSNAGLEWLGWAGTALGYAAHWIGRDFSTNSLTQIGPMIYSLGFFLLLILAFEGKVSFPTRVVTVLFLLPVALLIQSGLSSGQLSGVVTMACWISLVTLRVWKRVPILLFVSMFLFFIIFQPVKFYVRSIAWDEGQNLGPWQTLQVYAEGFRETYGSESALLANRRDIFQSSFLRINHLITTAAIIRDTPSAQPYLLGKSYWPLLTKWIPRALWPGKPTEEYGNTWAQRYGYLGANDAWTSFNLPWLPEMYMNFGGAGVVGIMFLIGLFFRFLWKRIVEQPKGPAEYAIAIMVTQSLVFVEGNFSLQFGGVIILAILLWLLGHFLDLAGVGGRQVGTDSQRPK